MNTPLIEACVDSYASCRAAYRGGADRLELCAHLVIGGTTPSTALFRQVQRDIPVKTNVLIRPRFGDFLYSKEEQEQMCEEIRMYRELGANGVVIGALTPDGNLDLDAMRRLMNCAGNMDVTLHRAFDMTRDPFAAMEDAIRLGCKTILTSGQQKDPLTGAELLRELPPPESLAEEDYRAQLLHLRQLCTELQSAADNRYRDAIEYYTTWAHQIKTPIASMRLALQGEDTALFRRLLSDLSRTEQYVEMVMAFLRLEDAPGDYVFREVALDEVLRQALRRFSAEFIDRRLRLDYTPTGLTVLTDEKWLCFVLEQLLSNALKYTREGSITVELAGERVLAIRDTGIGIAPEDLPRIFEKGYTGQNGRADKRASGLGLYLCSRICRNLGIGLTVKSTSGVGTTLLLDFTQYPLRVE